MDRLTAWKRYLLLAVPFYAVGLLVSCGGNDSLSTSSSSPVAPAIAAQPVSTTVVAGQTATFSVTATGDGLSYQWQRSTDAAVTWVSIAGATAASYTITVVDASANGFQFRAVITGTAGAVTSSAVTLAVTPAPTAPTISVQPADQSIVAGGSVTFSVTATGTSLAYQWQASSDGITWSNISGATNATLPLTAVAATDNGRRLRVIVSNSVGSVTSSAAVLTVTPAPSAPTISTQPSPATVVSPATATFSVAASGTPAVTYQWQVSTDGGTTFADIVGATGASYTTAASTTADSGKLFRVRVSNSAGSVVSNAVALTVSPTPLAPAITLQPTSQVVNAPATASFAVAVSGFPTSTYQWQISSDGGVTYTNIVGATAASYTTPATTSSDNGKRFRVVVTNTVGTATSNVATLTVATTLSTVARVATGSTHTCAIKSDSTVACWGANGSGQLGDGTTTDRLTPTAVPGLSAVIDIAAGLAHTCALRSNGTVVCWGTDGEGELGDNRGPNPAGILSVVAVSGLTNVIAIAAGTYHTCALRSDTSVACWGYNGSGELGDGSTANRYVPVVVQGLSSVVMITGGFRHACATKVDGTAYCWGSNNNGQLGDGTSIDRLVPTPVSGLTTASAISAGQYHSCALLASGSLSCWGNDLYGQLGDGATTVVNRLVPTPITSIGGVGVVSAANVFTCALKTDGTVYCWGNNDAGSLGDGTATSRSVPAIVPNLSGVVALSRGGGAGHMCAVKSDGSVLCWGPDGAGQLGISATTLYGSIRVPTVVLNLSALQ